MSDLKYFNDANFKKDIAEGVTIVDFYADWCGPCRTIAPIIEDLARELEGVSVGKMNVDSEQETASSLGVTSIPTVILFKDGQEVDRVVGVRDKNHFVSMVNRVKK